VTVISFLALGKHIPPHFIVLCALLNIFNMGGGGILTYYWSKIFSKSAEAYWVTVIYSLALGKHIPPHFIVLCALPNIFNIGGRGDIDLLLVKDIQ